MDKPRPFKVSELRTLRRGTSGQEVRWLHALLNSWLPSPDAPLPIAGSGSADFGPRTADKVKRFQQRYKIDSGTKDFMDGIVGQHTWTALHATVEVQATTTFIPGLNRPDLLPKQKPPGIQPPVLVPSLKLQPIGMHQVQMGGSTNIPFTSKATAGYQFQYGTLVLGKTDGSTEQGQIGIISSIGGGDAVNIGVFGSYQSRNLPLSKGPFTWTVQAQEAIYKSLTQGIYASSSVSALNITANWSLRKSGDNDTLQLTFQGGPYIEVDTPTNDTKSWKVSAGIGLFLGVTLSYYQF